MPCVALSTGKASINVDWQRYSIARDASAANAFHDLADSADQARRSRKLSSCNLWFIKT
jgi:hypothetical protein